MTGPTSSKYYLCCYGGANWGTRGWECERLGCEAGGVRLGVLLWWCKFYPNWLCMYHKVTKIWIISNFEPCILLIFENWSHDTDVRTKLGWLFRLKTSAFQIWVIWGITIVVLNSHHHSHINSICKLYILSEKPWGDLECLSIRSLIHRTFVGETAWQLTRVQTVYRYDVKKITAAKNGLVYVLSHCRILKELITPPI